MPILIKDLRTQLARANWNIGKRPTGPRFITLHWNGPTVAAFGNPKGEIEQLKFDARYHIAKDWGNGQHGDGIMYHGATLSDGSHYQLRDWNAVLWHCRNYEGNLWSLAWTCPLGGTQKPTSKQHYAVREVLAQLCDMFNIPWYNVRGHNQWASTTCPGTLQPILDSWRLQHIQVGLKNYVTLYNCFVRTKPLNDLNNNPKFQQGGKDYIIPANTPIVVDNENIIDDKYKDIKWVHLANGIGFIRKDLVRLQ